MKYKVGDKVKIRSWSDMEQEFGLTKNSNINIFIPFRIAMKEWCGEIVTIKKVYSKFYIIKEDNGWIWTDEMIDHYATKILSIIDRLGILRNIILKNKNKDIRNITGYNKESFIYGIDKRIMILRSNCPIFSIADATSYNNIFRKIKGEI